MEQLVKELLRAFLLELILLPLLGLRLLLIDEGIVDTIVQISVVIGLILPIQITTLLGVADYLTLLGLQKLQDVIRPLEVLRVFLIKVRDTRVERSKDNGLRATVLKKQFLLTLLPLWLLKDIELDESLALVHVIRLLHLFVYQSVQVMLGKQVVLGGQLNPRPLLLLLDLLQPVVVVLLNVPLLFLREDYLS